MLNLARLLMWASVAITFAALSRETARDNLFTLIGAILAAAALPYIIGIAVVRRTQGAWAKAFGIATCLFGVIDCAWRVQAFFFSTPDVGGQMAVWLPIYGVLGIPFAAVIAHTFLTAFKPEDSHKDVGHRDTETQRKPL